MNARTHLSAVALENGWTPGEANHDNSLAHRFFKDEEVIEIEYGRVGRITGAVRYRNGNVFNGIISMNYPGKSALITAWFEGKEQ